MISIRPEHAVNILNGKKTLELRTWIPKDYVGWVYVYVTKKNSRALLRNDLTYVENNELCFKKNYDYGYLSVANKVNKFDENPNLIGKVVFRFWFDEYETLEPTTLDGIFQHYITYKYRNELCLSQEDIDNYGKGKDLYAWHIKKLEIFEKPKELSDFGLKKAPQSWCYVYTKGE